MMPDVKRETKTGWLVFAGAAAVVLMVLWLIYDGGALANQSALIQAKLPIDAKEDMAVHVERQINANAEMRETIEKLKEGIKFALSKEFSIPQDAHDPGELFQAQFVKVRERLRLRAMEKHISYDENIGFGVLKETAEKEKAPYLMTMLQLTEKVVGIAFATPTPLDGLKVDHYSAVDTGPDTRPVLVREYPLRLTVTGGLEDILWILYQISQVDMLPDSKRSDYPLILRGFSIKSENTKPKDDVQQVEAVFELAAMHFITEEERAKDPLAFQPVSSGGTRAASSSGKPVFNARP